MREKSISKKPKSSDIALKVEHISKSFRLPMEQASGIKQAFINRMRGVKGYTKQQVLKDISFEVKKGDFFGIVGRNGSGKSTLLKLISQIYTPDSGKITVNGSLVPFIELGVGFNPELTGRENVYLNGAMLGFSKEEIDEMYDEIVEFAELHDFMDQKLKNYSSGMQVRLAFSVAIKAQGDILVLDEVLAVGDEAFQRKCNEFFNKIRKDKSKTIILVTHNMDSVKKYCNRAMMIRDGNIRTIGSPNDVANEYTNENIGTNSVTSQSNIREDLELGLSEDIPAYEVSLQAGRLFSSSDNLVFDIKYSITSNIVVDAIVIEISDTSRGNVPVILEAVKGLHQNKGTYIITYECPLKILNDGDYRISSTLRNKKRDVLAFTSTRGSAQFAIRNNDNMSKYPLLRGGGRVVNIESR